MRSRGLDTGLRCALHKTPIRYRADGHAECALWRECGSTSDLESIRRLKLTGRCIPP